jgi:hypothetical protein
MTFHAETIIEIVNFSPNDYGSQVYAKLRCIASSAHSEFFLLI